MGIPELFNIGLGYDFDSDNHVRFSLGSTLSSNETVVSYTGDFSHHFGGKTNLANRKRNYFKMGINFLREEDDFSIYKYGTLNIRFGWDFSLNRKTGIQVDIGPGFVISEKEIEKIEGGGWFDLDFAGNTFFPSTGVTIYYKL